MKFGQVIEYNKRHILFENHAEYEASGLVPDCFLFSNNEVKASGLQLCFNIFQ